MATLVPGTAEETLPQQVTLGRSAGSNFGNGEPISFNNATPIAVPTVTGSKGTNAALTSLILALKTYGLIIDTTS